MSYRPITDMWFLARAKLKGGRKYYGAYLGGFPERARVLIGCGKHDAVLHVCGGMAKHYPYDRGFGECDQTLDLDPATEPDYLADARDPFPLQPWFGPDAPGVHWSGILIDPPYSESDADHYTPGSNAYPAPNLLVKNAINAVSVSARIGIIHYLLPACPKNAKFVACVGVICGFNNRIRCFSVFERIA